MFFALITVAMAGLVAFIWRCDLFHSAHHELRDPGGPHEHLHCTRCGRLWPVRMEVD